MPQIFLYGTSGCHLCEEAEQIIRSTLPINLLDQLQVIEIIDHDTLYEQYHLTIPVLVIQPENIELSWPFTKSDLNTLFKHLSEN